jgi:hypothetical protein
VPSSAFRIDQPEGAFLWVPAEPLFGIWVDLQGSSISALFNGVNRRERYYGTRSRIFGVKSEDLGLSSEET